MKSSSMVKEVSKVNKIMGLYKTVKNKTKDYMSILIMTDWKGIMKISNKNRKTLRNQRRTSKTQNSMFKNSRNNPNGFPKTCSEYSKTKK